jgi:Xaa-Pro aminopeptidase
MNEKDSRLAAFCRENSLDGVYLRRRSNIAWITDGADVHIDTGSPFGIASILWTPSRKIVFTDNVESPRLAAEEFPSDWEFHVRNWHEPADHLPPTVLEALNIEPAAIARDEPTDQIAHLRFSLNPLELDRTRQLGRLAAATLGDILRNFPRASTEHALAGKVAGSLREHGVHCPVLLIAADDRIARFRHPIPTHRRIESAALCAICAQYQGLIVSLTRIVHFGALPADLQRRHDAVCRVDAALHTATTPGRRWCDAFAIAQRAYADTGFPDEWKLHHQGGPMGYELRDFKATPAETRTIEPSQLVGWNPSITGTKSEDTIISGTSGAEVITTDPAWPLTPSGRPDILIR